MALTQILRHECKKCGKIAVEQSRTKLGRTYMIKLMCGHMMYEKSHASEQKVYDEVVFADGARPRSYQFDAVRFIEESGFRCVVADEQGLGKTIEVGTIMRIHWEKVLPAIIAVPTTVKKQWMYELARIFNSPQGMRDPRFLTQVISSGAEMAIPGMQIYIITYDLLKSDSMFKLLPEGYVKLIVLDECQRIKNHLSDRAKAVQKIAKDIPYCIPMSGTPIKNNAGEYYTVLNLVRRTQFPHHQKFLDDYCDYYNNGWGNKVGGLKDMEKFHEDTKDIIIRRTKADVLKDLPSIDRKFYHVELDKKLNKAYASALDELEELMYSPEGSSFAGMGAKIAIMSKLRHITGISKVAECVSFSEEFLSSTDRKMVIFSHHQDVMGMIQVAVNNWIQSEEAASLHLSPICVMHSGLNGDGRANLVKQFKDDPNARIMVASTLAAGEGLNLQFCSDAVILERQWNPANEEQAEARFHRFGQLNNVSITYMLASGTIDELFTELVEVKRTIVAATMDKKEIQWDQQSLMKELSELLITRGKKSWKL